MTAEGQLPDHPSKHGIAGDASHMVSQQYAPEGFQCCTPKWYFSMQEIEDYSPSKKDGINFKKETHLRKLYCSFLQELGMTLKVYLLCTLLSASCRTYFKFFEIFPSFLWGIHLLFSAVFETPGNNSNLNDVMPSILSASISCKEQVAGVSYLLFSYTCFPTIATVSMFLSCKMEETPRLLRDVIVVGYETMYRRDPAATRRIKQNEVYKKQKELILIGERLLLATIAFDLNIQLPYKPLVAALKRLKIPHNDLAKVAWNFVNDWLWTTLCLQYKPHYIAAGSLFLAAKLHKVKLPSERGKVWWLEFEVSPKQLEDFFLHKQYSHKEVMQQMLKSLEQNRRQVIPSAREKATSATVVRKAVSHGSITARVSSNGTEKVGVDRSKESKDTGTDGQNLACGDTCIAMKRQVFRCQTSDCGSMNSVVENADGHEESEVQPKKRDSNQILSCKIVSYRGGFSKSDNDGINEMLKRRWDRPTTRKGVQAMNDDVESEAWIVRA
ncbi:hypothetical protein HHK36_018018 [Tetracentron sinense]|uniref:Uncharacterized protein n=1 Tax=Tetracentron sinense TaxID=13715 RepID=A0A834Z0Q5_TETSI|nr:hypothetical protein HHK36_018018 [Tetracentron sinense]